MRRAAAALAVLLLLLGSAGAARADEDRTPTPVVRVATPAPTPTLAPTATAVVPSGPTPSVSGGVPVSPTAAATATAVPAGATPSLPGGGVTTVTATAVAAGATPSLPGGGGVTTVTATVVPAGATPSLPIGGGVTTVTGTISVTPGVTRTVTTSVTPADGVTPSVTASASVTPSVTPTVTLTPTATAVSVTLQRHLVSPRTDPHDEHSTRARERIRVSLTIQSSADLTDAVLSDTFPAEWSVVSREVGDIDRGANGEAHISWRLGTLQALQPITRSYVLSSPAVRSGDYALHAQLQTSTQAWVDDWPVHVADPAPLVDPPLHATDVVIGGTTYNLVNTLALGSTQQTASAPLDVQRLDSVFVDAAQVSTWVSDPVPVGRQWAFGNPWSFDLFVRASATNNARVLFAARIYRVSGSGAATLLHQTPYSAQVQPLPSAAFQRLTWQDATLPATTLSAGERIGLSLLAFVDSNPQSALTAILGFDTTTTPSAVTWAVVDQPAAVPTSTTGGAGAPPVGPTPAPQPPAHNLHVVYGADTAACAGCHRSHTARGAGSGVAEALRKTWPEEQLCYTCHDGTTAPNIKGEFTRLGPPLNGSAMPIAATSGVHRMEEPHVGSTFSGINRHVECEDCHNPHLAGRGDHQSGTAYAAAPQQGVWGLSATWSAAWTPPTFGLVSQVTYQYELCFKCHSSWSYGASPPTDPSGGFPETDQSVEFSPFNPAYHPVAAVGKNPFRFSNGTSYAGSLLNGLTPGSNLVCSDCHGSQNTSDPLGPHGSNYPFILGGTWDRSTGVNSPNALCFKCHDPNVYANPNNKDSPWDQRTGFSGEGKDLHAVMVGAKNKANNDAPIVCMDCHVAVPHGWKRDRLIAFSGDGAPYVNRPYSGGLTTIDTWQPSGQWTFDSCGTAMNSCK